MVIKKIYRSDVQAIKFLNEYLKNFYSQFKDEAGNEIMPVAAHEFFILKNLEPYGIVPRVLGVKKNCIYMSFEGNSILSSDEKLTKAEFLRQAKNILHIFHKYGLRHNDLTPQNVLIRDRTIKIIDFTLADYGNIDIVSNLPDRNFAYLNQDYNLLNYKKYFPDELSPANICEYRKKYEEISKTVYNYHNLGVNHFPDEEPEKTPFGSGERYNFDRMSFMTMNFDFYGKNVMDLGCNSGWFMFQIANLGAKKIVGVDYEMQGIMGKSIRFAKLFAGYLQKDIVIVDQNLETVEIGWLAHNVNIKSFDATLVLSVLHHISDKQRLMKEIFDHTKEVVFYEDHEFWNELYDDDNNLIEVQGSGYKFDWNKDLTWKEKMGSLAKHEPLVLDAFRKSWREEVLNFAGYSKIKLLGFSEKRRPVLAMFK